MKKAKCRQSAVRQSPPTRASTPFRRGGEHEATLKFSPTAWAKLLFLTDAGQTEIGAFGMTAEDDPLYIEDLRMVSQEVSAASVEFDDEAVADFFDAQVDAGLPPGQFARVWVHTHPGNGPRPSDVDEETFERVFGRCEYAVMCIVARSGDSYARLRFNVGPGADVALAVEVDFSRPFAGSDREHWLQEYRDTVRPLRLGTRDHAQLDDDWEPGDESAWMDWTDADDLALADLASMMPGQRQQVLTDLGFFDRDHESPDLAVDLADIKE